MGLGQNFINPERHRLFPSNHPAFEAIDTWEARIFGSSAGISRYVGNNDWLVRPNYLTRLTLYPLGLARPRIPGLHRTNVYGLLRSRLLQQRARTPLASHAEALQFGKDGERLRLFYLGGAGRRLTAKSLPMASAAAEAARREVELRKRLQTLRSVALPRIESVMEERGRLYIAEELIVGRRFSVYLDKRTFQRQLLPQLAATYRALDIESRPLGDFLSPDLEAQVEAILAPLANAGEFRSRLAGTIAANPSVAAVQPGGLQRPDLSARLGPGAGHAAGFRSAAPRHEVSAGRLSDRRGVSSGGGRVSDPGLRLRRSSHRVPGGTYGARPCRR